MGKRVSPRWPNTLNRRPLKIEPLGHISDRRTRQRGVVGPSDTWSDTLPRLLPRCNMSHSNRGAITRPTDPCQAKNATVELAIGPCTVWVRRNLVRSREEKMCRTPVQCSPSDPRVGPTPPRLDLKVHLTLQWVFGELNDNTIKGLTSLLSVEQKIKLIAYTSGL
jgi:hypothetical protein